MTRKGVSMSTAARAKLIGKTKPKQKPKQKPKSTGGKPKPKATASPRQQLNANRAAAKQVRTPRAARKLQTRTGALTHRARHREKHRWRRRLQRVARHRYVQHRTGRRSYRR